MTLAWAPREFTLDGIRFRVRPGVKTPKAGTHQDLVMEWQTPIGWVPIRFLTVGVMTDFLAWNEDGLYPPRAGYAGGGKVLGYLTECYTRSVRDAEARLQAEKAAARDARNGALT